MEAQYYKKADNGEVICELCPHECIIQPGKRGICKVRKNNDGILIAETYEKTVTLSMDPVKKKPLYHYYPDKDVLSVGSIGCNMTCRFCQNCETSQVNPDEAPFLHNRTADKIVTIAKRSVNNVGIAFTYNEPVVWFEFMYDIALKAKKADLKTMMISNGFIKPEPLKKLLPYINAFNIDLKAFNDDFYHKLTGASLQPVLNSLKTIHEHKKHLEITNLIIPNHNDEAVEFEIMVRWIHNNLGSKTVLHLSRYFPSWKMSTPPTPKDTLYRLKDIAEKKLDYVYLGNI